MLSSVLAAAKIPDLKRRIWFLFAMFAVYVVGLHVGVPGVNHEILLQRLGSGNLFDMLDMFTGGAFKRYSIFAMGIMPYINASIIMQLLTIALPQLAEMQKEGAAGQKQIKKYTRYMTVVLAFVQAWGTTKTLGAMGAIEGGDWRIIEIAIILVAGTSFLMWLGELISEKGIGNGVSIIIFAGIVVFLPNQLINVIKVEGMTNGRWTAVTILFAVFIATIAFIVAMTQAQRKIPIQHVRRVVGNKQYGGQSTFLPLKVNSAGVIPIIFAVSIQYLPLTIASTAFANQPNHWFVRFAHGFSPGNSWWGSLIYFGMIVFFTYFYTAVSFNVKDVSDNLKKWGSYIPGIRPGKPTQEYLDRILTKITVAGALFLGIVALSQYYVPMWLRISNFNLIGGTSLLIVVGVALETMQAIEAHLVMRHYEGFIK